MARNEKLDLMLDTVDLEIDRLDLQVDRETLRLLAQVGREIRQMEETLMGNLDNINSALEGLSSQITQIGEQVASLQANNVTQEQLDDVATKITAAADQVDAIIEDESETTPEAPAEETPVEGQPPA